MQAERRSIAECSGNVVRWPRQSGHRPAAKPSSRCPITFLSDEARSDRGIVAADGFYPVELLGGRDACAFPGRFPRGSCPVRPSRPVAADRGRAGQGSRRAGPDAREGSGDATGPARRAGARPVTADEPPACPPDLVAPVIGFRQWRLGAQVGVDRLRRDLAAAGAHCAVPRRRPPRRAGARLRLLLRHLRVVRPVPPHGVGTHAAPRRRRGRHVGSDRATCRRHARPALLGRRARVAALPLEQARARSRDGRAVRGSRGAPPRAPRGRRPVRGAGSRRGAATRADYVRSRVGRAVPDLRRSPRPHPARRHAIPAPNRALRKPDVLVPRAVSAFGDSWRLVAAVNLRRRRCYARFAACLTVRITGAVSTSVTASSAATRVTR